MPASAEPELELELEPAAEPERRLRPPREPRLRFVASPEIPSAAEVASEVVTSFDLPAGEGWLGVAVDAVEGAAGVEPSGDSDIEKPFEGGAVEHRGKSPAWGTRAPLGSFRGFGRHAEREKCKFDWWIERKTEQKRWTTSNGKPAGGANSDTQPH
jgi:hypothetical protein